MQQTRYPRNHAERLAFEHLRGLGHTIIRRGWPDFGVVTKEGDFFVVEVKPKPTSELKPAQQFMMYELGQQGLGIYRFDPIDGLRGLTLEDTHDGHQQVLSEARNKPVSKILRARADASRSR